MYCWSCGARLPPRASACRRCGAEVGESLLSRVRVRPAVQLRRYRAIVMLITCVSAVALIGARYLRPMDLVTRPVPEVVSLTRREAEAAIRRAGLTPAVKLTESSEETLWERVLQQSPLGGMRAARGQEVRLLVAVRERGRDDSREVGPLITYEEALPQAAEAPPKPSPRQAAPKEARVATAFGVPRVTGKREREARRLLRAVGLGMRIASRPYSRSVPRGRVLRQDPAPGAAPPADENVRVVVSRGPRPRPATRVP